MVATSTRRILQPDLVSLMMPAFNAEGHIRKAVQSALGQTYPVWELVVVDDGSTDGTGEAVRQFADRRVRLISQENAGEALARNRALGEIRGEFLGFLDADDVLMPNHLEEAVGYLRRNPDRGGVYLDGYRIDDAGRVVGRLSDTRRGPFDGDLFEPLVRASDVFGPPGSVVLRTAPVLESGIRFDPAIVIGPDWDFTTAVAETVTFGRRDLPTYGYRQHPASITARVDPARRSDSLALCRQNAIRRRRFPECSAETRAYVFFDLLVNLLAGDPERQAEILEWPEFSALPQGQQARIVRLMAGRALVAGGPQTRIREWFWRAQRLNPGDRRNRLMARLYDLSPMICRLLLRIRQGIHLPQLSHGSP